MEVPDKEDPGLIIDVIQWYHEEQLVGEGPKLVITSLSWQDTGQYACRATKHNRGSSSAIATLEVASESVYINRYSNNTLVILHRHFLIICECLYPTLCIQ